jgi:hypothetical protein
LSLLLVSGSLEDDFSWTWDKLIGCKSTTFNYCLWDSRLWSGVGTLSFSSISPNSISPVKWKLEGSLFSVEGLDYLLNRLLIWLLRELWSIVVFNCTECKLGWLLLFDFSGAMLEYLPLHGMIRSTLGLG